MTIESIKKDNANCCLCGLSAERHNLVFGDGNPAAEIMIIGEGPGEQEDLQGIPFVGPAGKLLDDMLEIIDLDRTKVYIANIVKCRPPHNRDPKEEEISVCRTYIDRQIQAVNPKIIICLGRIASISLIRKDFRITKEHGIAIEINGIVYISTYHPSALLRDPFKRPEAFEDLMIIRNLIKTHCERTYI